MLGVFHLPANFKLKLSTFRILQKAHWSVMTVQNRIVESFDLNDLLDTQSKKYQVDACGLQILVASEYVYSEFVDYIRRLVR